MNTPLTVICGKYKIPNELRNIIQGYVRNDMMHKHLNEYLRTVSDKQYFYDEFVYETYIIQNCYCPLYYSKRECSHCFLYENTFYYKTTSYINTIIDNPQYCKVIQYEE